MGTQRREVLGGCALVKTSWPKGLVLPRLKDQNLNLERAVELI